MIRCSFSDADLLLGAQEECQDWFANGWGGWGLGCRGLQNSAVWPTSHFQLCGFKHSCFLFSVMGGQSLKTRTTSFRSETTNQFRFCSWCPGADIAARKQTPRNDSAGTCAGGLKGEPCSFCPDGKSWAGDKCADCGAAAVGWAAAVSLALIGVRTAYFYTNSAAAWHLRCCSKRGSFKRFCYSLWVFWKLWTSMMKAPKTPSLARNCFCEPKTGKGHVAKLEIETQRASSFIPRLPGEGWNCRFYVSCPVSSSAAPQLHALDCSVPRWTRTASSGSQCSPPDLHRKLRSTVFPAGMPKRMSKDMPDTHARKNVR